MTPEQQRLRLLQMQARAKMALKEPRSGPSLDDRVSGALQKVTDFTGGVQNRVMEGMSLGVLGDEFRAGIGSATSPKSYEEALTDERAKEEQFKEKYPKTAFVAEVAPALAPGGVAAKAVGRLAKGSRLAAGVITGAGAGATYGAMEGEGTADRAVDGLAGLVVGGLFGAAAPKVADTLTGLPRGLSRLFRRAEQRPTVAALKATKNAAYRAVDNAGETFTPDEMTGLSQRVKQVFDDGTYVEETDNASKAVLKILKQREGRPTKLSQLDRIRQNLWKRYSGAKDQPRILDAIAEIDSVIDQRSGASELMQAARIANSRYAKTQLLDDAFNKAELQTAGSGSGGNVLNKYRQAVTSVITNPRKAKFFTQDELQVMDQFVRGSFSENTLRKVGKLSPDGNGLMLTMHVLGGMASSGATLPLAAAGSAAKRAADKGVERGAEHILDAVSGFRPALPPPVPFNALAGGLASSGAPVSQNAIEPFPIARTRTRPN